MYADGFQNVTSVDFCENVINTMKARCSDKPELKCKSFFAVLLLYLHFLSFLIVSAHVFFPAGHVMDVLDLQFPAETFDVVIDKGTMDALMVRFAVVFFF